MRAKRRLLFSPDSRFLWSSYGITVEALILWSNGHNQITVEVSSYTYIDGKIFFNEVKLAKDDESVFDHSLHLCGTRFSTILKTART